MPGLRRHHLAHAADAALGVGERAVLLEERRARQEHVREAAPSRSGTGPARRRIPSPSSAGVTCCVFGIGLGDVLALDVQALERAVERRVEHVRNAQARLGVERRRPTPPRTCRASRRRRRGDSPENSCGNEPMSHEPCTLFWPRSGFTPTPSRPMLPVAIARFAMRHDHGRALAVLGDAETVVDRARCRRSRRAARRRGPQLAGTPVTASHRLGRIALLGDEVAPSASKSRELAALARRSPRRSAPR